MHEEEERFDCSSNTTKVRGMHVLALSLAVLLISLELFKMQADNTPNQHACNGQYCSLSLLSRELSSSR